MPESMMTDDNPFVQGFIKMYRNFAAAAKVYCDPIYADKIAKWDATSLMGQFIEVATPMRCGFQVMVSSFLCLKKIKRSILCEM